MNWLILPVIHKSLKYNYHRLFMHYGYFDIWVNSFEQLMIIVPYLIMGPGLFTGLITLGVLVQVSNAFSKVRESFSIFISNWTTITELRSIHKRLREFEQNINYWYPQPIGVYPACFNGRWEWEPGPWKSKRDDRYGNCLVGRRLYQSG